MAAFADDDSFADRDGRIGNGRQVGRTGCEHPLVIVERDACGHRNDDLLSQQFPDGCHDRLDLVGFHGDNHDVGKLRDSRWPSVERPEPVGLRVAAAVSHGRAHTRRYSGLDGFPANQAVREGLRHIPESDKSDFHSLSGLVYLIVISLTNNAATTHKTGFLSPRRPKIREPTRTIVEPHSTASG